MISIKIIEMFTWFSKINTFKGSTGDNTEGPDL